jgi:hypothetical protein
VDEKQQKVSVINIPESIQFGVSISSFIYSIFVFLCSSQ